MNNWEPSDGCPVCGGQLNSENGLYDCNLCDKTFTGDGSEVIEAESNEKLSKYVQAMCLLSTVLPWRTIDVNDPISLVREVLDDVAAAQERNTALQSEHLDHVNALNEQLAAAQERERTLNNKLYYACELAIAYAHSEKDKEWAAEIIEALTPPEQEE